MTGFQLLVQILLYGFEAELNALFPTSDMSNSIVGFSGFFVRALAALPIKPQQRK